MSMKLADALRMKYSSAPIRPAWNRPPRRGEAAEIGIARVGECRARVARRHRRQAGAIAETARDDQGEQPQAKSAQRQRHVEASPGRSGGERIVPTRCRPFAAAQYSMRPRPHRLAR
jgi:hypothetical protein